MSEAILVYEEEKMSLYVNLLKMIETIFEEREIRTKQICFGREQSEQQLVSQLVDKDVKYICTLDMAGFQIDTVLDIPAYNVIKAKQIHIIIEKDVMCIYGNQDMALNLYLFLPDEIESDKERYSPHIPNLNIYSSFEMNENKIPAASECNRLILEGMINKVIQEAEGII